MGQIIEMARQEEQKRYEKLVRLECRAILRTIQGHKVAITERKSYIEGLEKELIEVESGKKAINPGTAMHLDKFKDLHNEAERREGEYLNAAYYRADL